MISNAFDLQAVLDQIKREESPQELRRMREVVIPHMIGILDSERTKLATAVDVRFSQLNAAAAGPQRQREPGGCLP